MTLPYPPALNHLYATVNGRRVLSKAGRDFKLEAGQIAMISRLKMERGPVSVTVKVYRPRRAGDLDGCLKAILDSLTGIAWVDDSQVVEIHAYRYEDKLNPRAEIEITPCVVMNLQI